MPKSRKRKTGSNGARNKARFHARMLANATNGDPSAMYPALAKQFPWVHRFDAETKNECLADLSAYTIAAAGGDSSGMSSAIVAWETEASRAGGLAAEPNAHTVKRDKE